MRNAYDYLEHGLFRPKYVAKVGKWPNARYFYSQKEYQAYMHPEHKVWNEQTETRRTQALREVAEREAQRQYKNMVSSRRKQESDHMNYVATKRRERELGISKTKEEPTVETSLFEYITGASSGSKVKEAKRIYKKASRTYEKSMKRIQFLEAKLAKFQNTSSPRYKRFSKELEETKQIAAEAKNQSIVYEKVLNRRLNTYMDTTLPGLASQKIESGNKKLVSMLNTIGSQLISKLNPTITIKLKRKK